jgi:hypothetical protein
LSFEYLSWPSCLSLINDEKRYFFLHNQLISESTISLSQKRIVDHIDSIDIGYNEQMKTMQPRSKVIDKSENQGNKLIIDFPII